MPATIARILTYDEALSIQTALNAKVNAKLIPDGHFGELSKLALIRFKHDHGIEPEDDSPTLVTTEALGIPPITTPAPAPAPKLTPNPLVQAIAGFVVNYVLNNLILKGTGINMDFSKISKAVAAAISGAGIGGGAAAYTYISLPATVAAQLPSWVSTEVPIANMVIGALVGFLIVYFAPANSTAAK